LRNAGISVRADGRETWSVLRHAAAIVDRSAAVGVSAWFDAFSREKAI
jgi:hypothetical protein